MLLNSRRDTADPEPTMVSIRKPKFVDNAVYLGEISSATDDKKLVTIKQRKRVNYAIGSEKGYSLEN